MDRPEKKHLARTPLGTFLIVVGLLCLVTAGGFGSWQTVRVPRTGDATAEAPNVTGAGAACGFAIAGGLCFLGVAVAESRRLESVPPSSKDAEPGAAPDPGHIVCFS